VLEKRWIQALLNGVLEAQIVVLHLSHVLHRLLERGRRPHGYVVGMEEIAGLLSAIGESLDGAVTVNLTTNPLYDHRYDVEFDLGGQWSLFKRIRRLVIAPWVMGRLVARHKTFIYLGAQGFLVSLVDGRDREFAFLRAQDRTIVCYFAGSEIRSQLLMNEFGKKLGRDVLTTYEPLVSPGIATEAADRHRRKLAASAERHGQLIFNSTVDQMSYFERPTEPPLYFFPDERIRRRPDKWRDVTRPSIVHAPTSPVIKGTPLVRAALKALEEEGYDFEYTELSNQPNSEVLASLDRAHVVLNQFYAFIPGIFGIEALAANAVLLTSADGEIEPTLPPGANSAWVVTPYWQVYENLKTVLEAPEMMQSQADRGTAWVAAHCSRSIDQVRFHRLLAAVEE
jgi:hypothetical protein